MGVGLWAPVERKEGVKEGVGKVKSSMGVVGAAGG